MKKDSRSLRCCHFSSERSMRNCSRLTDRSLSLALPRDKALALSLAHRPARRGEK